MILGDSVLAQTGLAQDQAHVTLDTVFGRHAARRPEALALIDAPNRETFTDGAPRRLTYAAADRMIAAIAGRLRHMGLPTDAIVAVQLPNIVENVLAMLGVLRAGMIVAPLPLLWRRADVIAALGRIGTRALITCGRVGAFNHGHFALRVAAELFSIRYVCGFGPNLPDGVVPFDDLFDAETPDPITPLDRKRQSNAAAHVAAVTFDVGAGGVVPVARNHAELLAGGLGVLLESRLMQNANILSTFVPSSFAGIGLTLVPWLLSGGALALHHPFDPGILARQRRDDRCGTVILPGAVACALAATGILAGGDGDDGPTSVIAAWRSPDRLAMSPSWHEPNTDLVDISIFGEAALVPARRGADGRPHPIPFGPVTAPRASTDGVVVAELARTATGTLAARGPMVPHQSLLPGGERSGRSCFKIGSGGLVDSFYPCGVDSVTKTMVVSGPPAGIVSVGGYRFPLHDLQDVVSRIDLGATLAALPNPLLGQYLIGNVADRDTMQAALAAVGLNPIVVAAFRDRGEPSTAAAPRRAAQKEPLTAR